ncbi:uncharacterized protein K460DRAFT_423142 [Cucurbitaria berberidis CBS 394.84]|uniref:F-box domain-containing protein n=1 Tax=Cucurbitaria berberidis CBS 394.84 TaxID=1168544 RepID=A0A9P4LDQ6_9PLEO|nr:uncharacterized protein K460DRAFT_423142 [Cucurbitaria berberidis CBS 394.84]KAF1850627.1 hypothetical protein K460DRAFT_423142 [Cucurbitaria berberidis CBS 394.84]
MATRKDYFIYRRRTLGHRFCTKEAKVLLSTTCAKGFSETTPNSLSRFHHLPVELILNIVDFLPLVDSLSLHATCRKLRDLLKEMSKTYRFEELTPVDRDEFGWRCHLDYFRKVAQLEEEKEEKQLFLDDSNVIGPPISFLCSFCLDDHPLSAFTKAEMTKHPEERNCIGVTASMYICPCVSLTFQDLLTLRLESRRHIEGWYKLCQQPYCHSPRNTLPIICFETYRSPCILQKIHIPCQELDFMADKDFKGAPMDLEHKDFGHATPIVRVALSEWNHYICPHLHSSDDAVWGKAKRGARAYVQNCGVFFDPSHS